MYLNCPPFNASDYVFLQTQITANGLEGTAWGSAFTAITTPEMDMYGMQADVQWAWDARHSSDPSYCFGLSIYISAANQFNWGPMLYGLNSLGGGRSQLELRWNSITIQATAPFVTNLSTWITVAHMDISRLKPSGLVDVNMSIRAYDGVTGVLQQELTAALVDQVAPPQNEQILYRGILSIPPPAGTDYAYLQTMYLAEYMECHWEYEEENGVVTFTDTSTNAEYWEWDFGDGNTSNEENPVHSYGASGIYTVTLTINEGGDSSSQNITIPVMARIIPVRGPAPLLVNCTVLR